MSSVYVVDEFSRDEVKVLKDALYTLALFLLEENNYLRMIHKIATVVGNYLVDLGTPESFSAQDDMVISSAIRGSHRFVFGVFLDYTKFDAVLGNKLSGFRVVLWKFPRDVPRRIIIFRRGLRSRVRNITAHAIWFMSEEEIVQKVSKSISVDPEKVKGALKIHMDWYLLCTKEVMETSLFRKLIDGRISMDKNKTKLLQRELIKCSQL